MAFPSLTAVSKSEVSKPTESQIRNMTVDELKATGVKFGIELPTRGLKADLLARVLEYFEYRLVSGVAGHEVGASETVTLESLSGEMSTGQEMESHETVSKQVSTGNSYFESVENSPARSDRSHKSDRAVVLSAEQEFELRKLDIDREMENRRLELEWRKFEMQERSQERREKEQRESDIRLAELKLQAENDARRHELEKLQLASSHNSVNNSPVSELRQARANLIIE